MPPSPQNPKRPSFVSPLLAAVMFGFASGVVGALVVIAVAPTPAAIDATASALRPVQGRRPAEPSAVPVAVQAAANAAVEYYPQKNLGSGPLARSYHAWEAIGAGVVLTSDGWLLGHGGTFSSGKSAPKVAVVAGRSYPVEKIVRDSYSGVVFVKIDAVNLPVRAFGDDTVLEPGDLLYAFDLERGIHRADIIAFGPPPAKNENDLVRSSERLQRLIRISRLEAKPGTLMLSSAGEIVGILTEDGGAAIPFSSVSSVIGAVLKEGAVVRPKLGVGYVDLSRTNRPADATGARIESGALIAASADGKKTAVLKGSPAAMVGLRAGDIVTEVDGEAISARKSLADILVSYAAGANVKLTVRRGNAVLSLDAALGREEGK